MIVNLTVYFPADTDNPNDNERHIRWVYGVAGSDMADVIVGDGTPYQQNSKWCSQLHPARCW